MPLLDRRSFLEQSGAGFGALALSLLALEDLQAAAPIPRFLGKGRPDLNGGLHHRAKAKR